MDWTPGDILTLIIALIACVGLVATWARNGKAQAGRDSKLETNQKIIIKRLDDPETGLAGINQKFNEHLTNFADVNSGFRERLQGHDRVIRDLKKSR